MVEVANTWSARNNSAWLGLGVFLTSLAVFAIFLFIAPDSFIDKPCSDCAGWYYPVAESLAAGKGLVVGDIERPALDRPPGQVLLLAGLFKIGAVLGIGQQVLVYALNIVLLSVSGLLLFLIARIHWGPLGGLVSAALWVTSPFVLWFLNQPFSEVPFFVCLFFASWRFLVQQQKEKPVLREMLFVGATLGLAAMIRPIGIFLAVPFLLTIWSQWQKPKMPSALLSSIFVCLGVMLVITPWHVYLYQKSESISFLSRGSHLSRSLKEGFVFALRTEEYKVEIPINSDVSDFMREMHIILFEYQDIPGGIEKYGPGRSHDVNNLGNILAVSWTYFRRDPELFGRFLWLKISRSWYGTDSHRNEQFALILQIFYLLIVFPALVKAMRYQVSRSLALLTSWVTLYFWVFSIMFTPLVRYMIPALGMLFLVVPGLLIRRDHLGDQT